MAGIIIQPPGWAQPQGYSNGILSPAGEITAKSTQHSDYESRHCHGFKIFTILPTALTDLDKLPDFGKTH